MAQDKNTVNTYPYLYWGIILGYSAVALLTGALWPELRWWIWIAFALHIALSWQILDANDRGGIFFLGIPLKEAWVGPNFVMLGFMTLGRLAREPHQKHFPDEPDMIHHGDDKDELPLTTDSHGNVRRKVRPIRIVSGGPRPTSEYDSPLNIQMTTKFNGTARFYIEDFFAFWVQFPGESAEEKFAEADRQLEDTFVRTVKREWQKRPIGLIITDDDEIHDKVVEDLEKQTKSWGIRFEAVNLYSPDLSHDLSKELTRIGEATAKMHQTKTNADAARYQTEQAGIADAASKLARENADTDAAAYRSEKLGMTGREVIGLEAASDILNPRDKFFFGANALGEAVGVGTTLLDSLRKMEGKPDAIGDAK